MQLCLAYTADDVADIVSDLFQTYANVPSENIPLTAWQTETASFLQTVYTTLITEPTSVNKLVSELVQQAALAICWDSEAELIRLQVLRPIATNAAQFTESNGLDGSLSTRDQPNTRLSEVLIYFGLRDPLKPIDEADNYRSARLVINLNAEQEYGGLANKTIFSRWIPFGASTVADRLGNILLARFIRPSFGCDSKDGDETVGFA